MAEPGVFQAFYDGPLQHPGLLWVAAAAALGFTVSQSALPRSTRHYCVALVLLSITDAWLTSNEVLGVGALSGAAARLVPLFFVLLGDLRFLLVVTSGAPGGVMRITGRTLVIAAALTLIVPAASQVVLALLPDALTGARTLFLVYEVSFAVLTLVLLRSHPNARLPWVRTVARFVLAYYTLWAGADVLILLIGDLGFLLRVVPNVLYYGGLIGVVAWAAVTSDSATREGTPQERAGT